jgi:hypothetical protein
MEFLRGRSQAQFGDQPEMELWQSGPATNEVRIGDQVQHPVCGLTRFRTPLRDALIDQLVVERPDDAEQVEDEAINALLGVGCHAEDFDLERNFVGVLQALELNSDRSR